MMDQAGISSPALEAFSRQSAEFDAIDAANPLIAQLRERVRKAVVACIKPGLRMLELNAGTGLDSVWFAEHGVNVVATEAAPGMLDQLNAKQRPHLPLRVRACSFTELPSLQEGLFDVVFSNFGGLNCTDRLDKVLHDVNALLRPGGVVALVIMPKVCLWELGWLLRLQPRRAFRRWNRKGAMAHLEGVTFPCSYYAPALVARGLPGYERLHLEGLAVVQPPPHATRFAGRWPRLTRMLTRLEAAIARRRPFRSMGDHYLIILRKPG